METFIFFFFCLIFVLTSVLHMTHVINKRTLYLIVFIQSFVFVCFFSTSDLAISDGATTRLCLFDGLDLIIKVLDANSNTYMELEDYPVELHINGVPYGQINSGYTTTVSVGDQIMITDGNTIIEEYMPCRSIHQIQVEVDDSGTYVDPTMRVYVPSEQKDSTKGLEITSTSDLNLEDI